MKIKVLKSIRIGGVHHSVNQVAEVNESLGRELINRSAAAHHIEPSTPTDPKGEQEDDEEIEGETSEESEQEQAQAEEPSAPAKGKGKK
ncbi:MAG: hypothetical protein PW734_06905 [Verrucomicrobium sp.]|nr:hypothetical protein [Verrucomicrobium sp.]